MKISQKQLHISGMIAGWPDIPHGNARLGQNIDQVIYMLSSDCYQHTAAHDR
ncbi:hypothetical protein J23TS9_02520 [Paenibacillus sp. J23TS9]|nr:hypothetical protein J23TS9_02520 [Paenibacillus sp. J23TS9]